MSAYIPRQLTASWDTFKMYLSKGFPSCRIGLRTQNSNKYIKTIMEKEKYKKLNIWKIIMIIILKQIEKLNK